jgi:hypothetical protein
VYRIVTAAARWTLSGHEALLMTSAAAVVMIAMAAITGTFTQRERLVSGALPVLAVSVLAIGLGIVTALSAITPVAIIIGLITLCAVQARTTRSAMPVARG